jgi:phosphoribosylformimino-5-aminoimidazole carboxamide ribonucleotide (ProFAR) isomerase
VRSVERAQALVEAGASKVIVGTAAYDGNGVNHRFLEALGQAIGREKILLALDSQGGHIVVKGWREATDLRAEEVIEELEPYCGGFLCTYVDKEGMLEGTDLDWYARLRGATEREITAAGGITTLEEIRRLGQMGVHAALGMAIYTGKLDLKELARILQEDS